jgi:hypothetical protein
VELSPARHRHWAYGNLPVMEAVKREAVRRAIELVILPSAEAMKALRKSAGANAILHVTC